MEQLNGITDHSAHSANSPDCAAELDESDFANWLSKEEACAVLGFTADVTAFRRLRGMALKRIIEGRKRHVPGGRVPEPIYRPSDVARLAAKNAPKPMVFSADSGMGPRPKQAPPSEEMTVMQREFVGWLGEFTEQLLARLPQQQLPAPVVVDRGRWLRIPTAAKHSGLTKRLLHRVWREKWAEGSPDVILDGGRKIRRAAVDELDSAALRNPAGQASSRAVAPVAAARSAKGGAV